MYVFIIDTNKQPLDPCHPSVARKLLKNEKAAIFKRFPFTIILKEQKPEREPTFRLKIDPGSKTTGLALVKDNEIIWGAEISHRGLRIKDLLLSRRQLRRGRRARHTRYRQARFLNRTRNRGWLPPSLESRVYNIMTWVKRIQRIVPISDISMELVKFDMQKMVNPEISGLEYQQGELVGYEVREYLLEKWGRKCAYCGKKDIPLQIEHIIPRARGGSDRVSNLTLACEKCNQKKGTKTAEEFGFRDIQKKAKAPLKDAAAVNATRWRLYQRLTNETDCPIETGSGSLTKYNRHQCNLEKTHWLDAACVGRSTPHSLINRVSSILEIKAMGHGVRQKCRTNKYGFPVAHSKRAKSFMRYQTGDIVKANVPPGLKTSGKHTGRIAIKHSPSFMLNGMYVNPRYMSRIQHADGYGYKLKNTAIQGGGT